MVTDHPSDHSSGNPSGDLSGRPASPPPGLRARVGTGLIVMLGALTALGPMTVDLYLPALPEMTHDLATTESALQLTLTAALVGLAVGQAIVGPVSDVVGRRRPLVVGMAVYVAASVACALAPTVHLLVGARLAQAFAGAAGIVIARAIVRDLVSGAEIARLFSMLLLVTGLAPILAPVLGGQLLRFGGWRVTFWAIAGFGALLFVAVLFFMKDSLPVERRRQGGIGSAVRTYAWLARDRALLGYVLATGFGFAGMFAYISGSPFVYQQVFGISPQWYGVLFGVNGVGLMIFAQSNGRLVRRFDPHRLLTVGQSVSLVGGLLLVLAAATMFGGVPGVLIPLFFAIGSFGMVAPNATALALARHPEAAGTASALLGTFQFVIGAAVGPLVTVSAVRSAVPMAVVVAGCVVLGLVARVVLTRSERAEPGQVSSEGPRAA